MKKTPKQQEPSAYPSGFRPVDLSYFSPLEVKIEGRTRTEDAIRLFKSIVQKDKVLALYKEKSHYEKPSVKKRRKQIEAAQKRYSADMKEEMMRTGEWDKRVKRKQKKLDDKKNTPKKPVENG